MDTEYKHTTAKSQLDARSLGSQAADREVPILQKFVNRIREYTARIHDDTYVVEQATNALLGERPEAKVSTAQPTALPMHGGLYGDIEAAVNSLEEATERLNAASRRTRTAA